MPVSTILLQIAAAAQKALSPRAGEDGDPQRGIMFEPLPGGEQPVANLLAQRVARLGPVEGDDRDPSSRAFDSTASLIRNLAGGWCGGPIELLAEIGWAISIQAALRSARVWPFSSAAPYSVTMISDLLRAG